MLLGIVPGQSLHAGLVAEHARSLGINRAWHAETYGQPGHKEQDLQVVLLRGHVQGLWNQRPGFTRVPTHPGCEAGQGGGLSLLSWKTGMARPTSRACAHASKRFLLPVLLAVILFIKPILSS